MKKIFLFSLSIFITALSYSQFNAGVHNIHGNNFDLKLRNWGYSTSIGYMIKQRVNIAAEYEHTRMSLSFYTDYLFFSINSAQAKATYHIVQVKYIFNPYIEVEAGVFRRAHKMSFNHPYYVDNAYGVSGALGSLFRIHQKLKGLYINGKLKYQYVNYEFNKTKCINAELGLVYLLRNKPKEKLKETDTSLNGK